MKKQIMASSRLLSLLSLLIVFFIWELCVYMGFISSSLFPAPSKILLALWKLIVSGDLTLALKFTLLRFFAGLISGCVLGALLGLMMGWWRGLYDFLNPFIAAFYPIPKIAIFPLFMIIFGLGEGSKFFTILLSAFFPMLITSVSGVWQINKVYFEVGRNYGAHGRNIFTEILLPGSLPSLLAGLELATNTAFVITISVEIISAHEGLGVLLWFGWETFRVSDLYAVLVVLAMLGVIFNYLLGRLAKVSVPWMGK